MNPAPPWGRAAFGIGRPFMQSGRVNSPLGNVHPFNTRHNTFGAGGARYVNRTRPNTTSSRNLSGGSSRRGTAHYSGAGSRGTTGGPIGSGPVRAGSRGPTGGSESASQSANDDVEGLSEAALRGLDQPLHWPAFWNAWYRGNWLIPSSKEADEWLEHWRDHPWGGWARLVARDGPANWVAGSTFFSAGLGKYENPYISGRSGAPVDYSLPVDTEQFLLTDREPQALAFGPLSEAMDLMRAGNYSQALARFDGLVAQDPGNVALHELRSLALFGLQRFDEAAETLYAVLSVAPGSNWTTMIAEFGSLEVYNRSLGALREHLRTPQHTSAGHFVIAYHYLSQGHSDAARVHFQRASEGEPRDQVSRLMIDLLPDPKSSGPPAAVIAETPEEAVSAVEQPPIEDEDNVAEKQEELAAEVARAAAPYLGQWNSRGAAGEPISVEFLDDGSFRWKRGGTPPVFESEGRYEINSDMIGLQFATGALLLARIGKIESGQVVVEPMRAPPGTAELTFSKE